MAKIHKQKKKARTKKQLKKSVNRLYEALMAEREKHRRASKMVGQLKQTVEMGANMLRATAEANIRGMQEKCALEKDNTKTLDISAELIKRITK